MISLILSVAYIAKDKYGLLTNTIGFHPGCHIDCVSKQTIARHLEPNHSSDTGSWRYANILSYIALLIYSNQLIVINVIIDDVFTYFTITKYLWMPR